MISDYFVTPIIYRNQDDVLKTSSTIAMIEQLYKLKAWASSLSDRVKQSKATYPFPKPKLKLLNFLIHSNTDNIDSVKTQLDKYALPVLERADMVTSKNIYQDYTLYNPKSQLKASDAIAGNIISITN